MDHIKVLVEAISEEVVDDMEAVLVSIIRVVGGSARSYSINHFSCLLLNPKTIIIN